MDPRNPELYDTLIQQEEQVLQNLTQQMEDTRHRIDQLTSMQSLAREFSGTPAPVMVVRETMPAIEEPPARGISVGNGHGKRVTAPPKRVFPPPHKYDTAGNIIIPPLRRSTNGPRPPRKNRLVITNFLREKGLSPTLMARYKAGFGSVLKRTADAAGRSYEWEKVKTSSYDASVKVVQRVVWYEKDRDLFEYVWNRSYARLFQDDLVS